MGIPPDKRYYVYIMTGQGWSLYTGVTKSLYRRVFQHKTGAVEGFTSRYKLQWLVYFEVFRNVRAAIAREKQVKSWTRAKKIALVETQNPGWKDLSAQWYSKEALEAASAEYKKQLR